MTYTTLSAPASMHAHNGAFMRGTICILAMAFSVPVSAQTPADHVARGTKAIEALKPEEALRHFEAAIAADSLHFDATWRAARATMELSYMRTPAYDSLVVLAERYATRARAIDSLRPEGHAMIALATGWAARLLMSQGTPESMEQGLGKMMESIRAATRSIVIDPKQDLPYRVRSGWYSTITTFPDEIRQALDPLLEEVAMQASWENAIKDLEQAVKVAPSTISNRYFLGKLYAERKRYADARPHLRAVDSLPVTVVSDPKRKEEAKRILAEMPAE